MADDVVVICPELPPAVGGVGDYTIRVTEQWRRVSPRFVVANPVNGASGHEVEQLDATARAVRDLPPHAKVLVQYSAYGFHPLGYPRALLRALLEWKRASGGVLVLMFHEIWTFWPLLNKNRPLQSLHRRDIAALTLCADAVFTSTRSQAEHLRTASGRVDVEVLPVGSNIRPSATPHGDKRDGRAVLFGLQASRLATLRKVEEHLGSLASHGIVRTVVTVGGGNTPRGDAEEKELLARIKLPDGVDLVGALREHEVSELLASSSFAVSAQDELSVTKSGTFVAYAAHGLNILSPHANASSAEPLCWAIHPAEPLGGIADSELRLRAESLRAWHDRTCSWQRIAREFARALRLEVSSEPIAAPVM
ncbi:MAG TPA: hypothetical protein VK993_10540 [Chthoniobacterales bacterium]|nr:hypothetical protein [Chthoniobacterales bacterium]